MAIVDSFSTSESFWDQNPQLQVAGPFGKLHKSDKSRGKDVSSKKMWALCLMYDRKSKYYNVPIVDRRDIVYGEFYGDLKWWDENKELEEELRAFYLKLNETTALRTLRSIEEKLKERDDFIKVTEYTMGDKAEKGWIWGTVDTLDRMMANTKKLYDMYDEARKMVEQEEEQGTAVGGAQQSLSDEGAI